MTTLINTREHYNDEIFLPFSLNKGIYDCLFQNRNRIGDTKCYVLTCEENRSHLLLSYYVGVDWIEIGKHAIYIEPKLNSKYIPEEENKNGSTQTDYLFMLFSALKHPELFSYTDQLFEIKNDLPEIEISQKKDLLTPLLIIQFLRIVQQIVKKGIKKSYYKIETNLNAKIKGKIQVSHTIKMNVFKVKPTSIYCIYEEFGINSFENRLLKKTLTFIQRYLPSIKGLHSEAYTSDIFNFIMPAFQNVTEEVNVTEIKNIKFNPFYKEYQEAIRLGKLILKRFGYNISNTQQTTIKTPPFWIDMSKLFELYVLGLLKDRFRNEGKVNYHFGNRSNELDYLLNSIDYKMVIDAKYKPRYIKNGLNKRQHEDIRQISGYSRLEKVYNELKIDQNALIDCLIIYPDQINGVDKLIGIDLKSKKIKDYVRFFKISVKLPEIKN